MDAKDDSTQPGKEHRRAKDGWRNAMSVFFENEDMA
jgi:hypothetical protein